MIKNNIQSINFSQHITPLPIEVLKNNTDDDYVRYGVDNLYPNFLLKLYNDSALHKGIINSKVDYIKGDGLQFKGGGNVTMSVGDTESLNTLVGKVIKDTVVFNYFAIEVVYNTAGEAIEYNHIPAQKIRTNKSRSKFWYCEDWFAKSKNLIDFDRWRWNVNTDLKSKVFFYVSYTPSVNNVYPIPEYSGALKSIETDIAISDFHINNINNSFSVSSIVSFFNGEPPEDVQEAVLSSLKESYTGTKGQKIIVNFNSENGKAAEVTNISPTEWNDAFLQLSLDVQQRILVAHSAVSPLLFGVKTEGQLGGATELETAYTIFKNLYVNGRREEIAGALNSLFSERSDYKEMEFKDSGTLFSKEISDATKEKIYTINELRKEAGLSELKTGNRLLNEQVPDEDKQLSFSSLQAPTIDKILHLGLSSESFHILRKDIFDAHSYDDATRNEMKFNSENRIADYLLENLDKGKTLKEIQANVKRDLGLDVALEDIEKEINQLVESNIIERNDVNGSIRLTPLDNNVKNIRRVEVRYEYSGPKDHKNRTFCAKLMELNRLYTREEIQTMSYIFGYDIWQFRGGWYHNPDKNVTTPSCRHTWKPTSVVQKGVTK